VKLAKQQGKDVTDAQKSLDTAESIRDSLPVLWHGFDLPHFEQVIDSGIKAARQAQQDTGVSIAKPSTPGFSIIISLAGLFAMYLLMRRGK